MRFLQRLRPLLKQEISKDLPNEPVALLFSGGTDSLTVLWTLMELGAKVTCYTFHLSYFISNDAKASKAACKHWNVPQVIVNEDNRDKLTQLKDVIKIIKSPRKTHVEVMYGYYFLMQAIKEKHVYSGIQADTLYGSNKNAAIQCGKKSAKFFTDYRKALLANPGQEGLQQAHLVANHFGKIFHAPYSCQPVRDYFFEYNWKELNRPKQKMPAIIAFADRFKELPIYRHDDNMQCGSRLREHLADYVKLYRRIYNG